MATRRRTASGRRRLVWTNRAHRDLDINAYIASDDAKAAARWIDKLLKAAERAARLPMSGAVVREFGREDIRQMLVGTYRLVYRVCESQVDVLTVFEGHHLLPDNLE